jgi:LAS superfamily LD-carboxypeptidase LdcB
MMGLLFGMGIVLTHDAIAQVNRPPGNWLNQKWFPSVVSPPSITKAKIHKDVSTLSPALDLDLPTQAIRYLGHLPYAEAHPADLMVVASYNNPQEQRFERLQSDAGLALMRMLDAARADGVWIVTVSGFRDRVRQDMLFQIQTEHQGSVAIAAQTVAPPGYSEHHTGYAVDLADGLARAWDVSLSFGETDAFRWLTENAQRFGFEMSFPADNPQGVSYEPWHWRFVGSPGAEQTFAQARE